MDRAIEKKNWTTKNILLYGVLPVLVLVLIYFMVNGAGVSRFKVQKDRLNIATVAQASFQERIPITGEVLPKKTVYITAIEGGQIKEVYLEGGEMVKKGDPLLKLTNPGLELNYMNLQTNLLEQADQLRNTRITMENTGLQLKDQLIEVDYMIKDLGQRHARSKALYDDEVISEAEYQVVANNYEYQLNRRRLVLLRIQRDSLLSSQQFSQVNNSLDLVDRNLSAIQRSLDNLTIKAPVSGLMSAVRVEIGENVNQGQNLGQIDMMEEGFMVRARVDEHYNGRIFPGQGGTFPFSSQEYHLIIRKVYSEVSNGSFEVDMDFIDGAPEGIKRGQNLQIRLALSDESEAILIPRGGFYHKTGGRYIYVVTPEGDRAVKREIEISRQSDQHYEVVRGLEPGEKVITSSYDTYNDVDELILQPD
ncbi:MAG: HlyD family efflux transporter periplasmic adaptor subunit [Bacteroidia bacterium]|nr:HlyD family efflux transporter periplasmic adaptor subunit [Bacteroidia bacterium]